MEILKSISDQALVRKCLFIFLPGRCLKKALIGSLGDRGGRECVSTEQIEAAVVQKSQPPEWKVVAGTLLASKPIPGAVVGQSL